jgi:methionine synthase II (cobalamin-independent)
VDKTVVLGLISSKLPALESVDDLKARVHAAAETIANGTHKRSVAAALNQCVPGYSAPMTRMC